MADTILASFDAEAVPELKKFVPVTEDAGYIGYLINGNYEELPDMVAVSDFAICFADEHYIFEVDVFKFDDTANKAKVKKLLEDRLAFVKQMSGNVGLYNPDQAPIMEGAEIVETDKFILLIITPDNDKVKSVISDIVSGKTIPTTEGEKPSVTPTTSIVVDANGVTRIIMQPPVATTERVPTTRIETQADGKTVIVTEPTTKRNATTTTAKGTQPTNSPLVKIGFSTITQAKNSRNNHYLIAGKCEQGVVLTVTGGISTIITKADHTNFIVEVPIKNSSSMLSMTVQASGKAPSDSLNLPVDSRTDLK